MREACSAWKIWSTISEPEKPKTENSSSTLTRSRPPLQQLAKLDAHAVSRRTYPYSTRGIVVRGAQALSNCCSTPASDRPIILSYTSCEGHHVMMFGLIPHHECDVCRPLSFYGLGQGCSRACRRGYITLIEKTFPQCRLIFRREVPGSCRPQAELHDSE